MDLVGALRVLWRCRFAVAVGVAVALALGTLTAFKVDPGGSPMLESRQRTVGVASASVLVDSQSSQVVDLGGEGDQAGLDVTALASRARLLATLMGTRPLKDQIAGRAGVASGTLVTRVASAQPEPAPAPVTTGTTVSAKDPKASVMTLQTAETLPIVTVNVRSPTETTALRLAASAIEELMRYMRTVAARNRVPSARQLVVTPLGPAGSATVEKGVGRVWTVVVFVLVLALWCGAILAISVIARKWRDADARERRLTGADMPLADALAPAYAPYDGADAARRPRAGEEADAAAERGAPAASTRG